MTSWTPLLPLHPGVLVHGSRLTDLGVSSSGVVEGGVVRRVVHCGVRDDGCPLLLRPCADLHPTSGGMYTGAPISVGIELTTGTLQ